VDWFTKFVFIPIGLLTWFGIALLLFFVHPILGVLALFFAALLTEALLSAYRAEQPALRDRTGATE
jgi:hypothetical protein